MANVQAPFGFRQFSGNGSAPTYEQVTFLISSSYNTAIYFGDPVIPVSTGYIQQATASTVQLAGIFMGCSYYSTSQKKRIWNNYWPGSDATGDVTAFVCNDPNAMWLVQAGGSTTAIGQADIFSGINLGIGTGSTATGISGAFVDQTTLNTTNTLPFRVVKLITDPPGSNGADTTTGYNYVVVMFNNVMTKQLLGV